jgi:RNA polymerase sigma factor (sigma-70 family)
VDAELARRLDLDMARLARGERAVFSSVFCALWPVVRAFCRKRAGSDPDADDVTQLVMEKIFASAARYDPKRPALPWVLAIASWECKSFQKRRSRKREDRLDAAPEMQTPEPSPEDSLMLRELEQAACSALERLSPDERQAVVVGLSGEARPIAVPAATFRKRRERAFRRLRLFWRKLNGD